MPKYNPPRFLFRQHEILKNANGGGKFLEVGAGNLMLTQNLLKKYDNCTCIDYPDYTLKYFNSLSHNKQQKINLITGDFTKIEIKEKFDLVVCCEVLEHINSDLEFLRRLLSKVKENGQVILSVPSRMKYWSVHDEIVGHVRRYEKNELYSLAKKAGLDNIKIISYGFPFLNLLRFLRIGLAKAQKNKKKDLDQVQQSIVSGGVHASSRWDFLGALVNYRSIQPFSKLSSIFNALDLSDGYILVATLPQNKTAISTP